MNVRVVQDSTADLAASWVPKSPVRAVTAVMKATVCLSYLACIELLGKCLTFLETRASSPARSPSAVISGQEAQA